MREGIRAEGMRVESKKAWLFFSAFFLPRRFEGRERGKTRTNLEVDWYNS